jgi:MerR family transcriptional regulator, copper efflux regulator
MQIGEVADRTSLSLRTIRYYEEVGLVIPSARSQGGFRLYTDADVDRLRLIRRMKPLELSLDEMRDLLGVLDELRDGKPSAARRRALLDRLAMYRGITQSRIETLRAQLDSAEQFARDLVAQETAPGRARR